MERIISKRAAAIPHSGIRKIHEMSEGMQDVIHLEIGEPDFCTPSNIIQRAFDAANEGQTHYTHNAGTRELREKLSTKLSAEVGTHYEPEEIVITAGATEALLLACLVTLDEGDEVIVPSPHWPNYLPHILLAGAQYKEVILEERLDFKITRKSLGAAVSDRTKGLILNYPHNPTGAILEREDLEVLAEFVKEKDLLVYSDEAYEKLVYDGNEFCSISSIDEMKERTIIVRSFSKTYAMTGWRVAYFASPLRISALATRLHENTTICASAVAQAAALAALTIGESSVQKMLREYARRRDVLIASLDGIAGVSLFEPRGTFFAFLNIRELGMSSSQLAERLLLDARVAVTPGDAFGLGGEGYIRISFANSLEKIREAIKRMKKVFKELS